ncbi:unnamed protein product [Lymnaea stagnalis]|uniref:Uncharacterized protein n=1 Tax=Lymnaea stagnalis TaxID=6523 RepID=A0AAV2H1A0_LYMST
MSTRDGEKNIKSAIKTEGPGPVFQNRGDKRLRFHSKVDYIFGNQRTTGPTSSTPTTSTTSLNRRASGYPKDIAGELEAGHDVQSCGLCRCKGQSRCCQCACCSLQ